MRRLSEQLSRSGDRERVRNHKGTKGTKDARSSIAVHGPPTSSVRLGALRDFVVHRPRIIGHHPPTDHELLTRRRAALVVKPSGLTAPRRSIPYRLSPSPELGICSI